MTGVVGVEIEKLAQPLCATLVICRPFTPVPPPAFVMMTVCAGAGVPVVAGGPTCGSVVVKAVKPELGDRAKTAFGGLPSIAPWFVGVLSQSLADLP